MEAVSSPTQMNQWPAWMTPLLPSGTELVIVGNSSPGGTISSCVVRMAETLGRREEKAQETKQDLNLRFAWYLLGLYTLITQSYVIDRL
jgi:hypothetical protein